MRNTFSLEGKLGRAYISVICEQELCPGCESDMVWPVTVNG